MVAEAEFSVIPSPEERRAVRRRWLAAATLGGLVSFVLFACVLQSGRDGLLGQDLLGNFYDGQALALLHGHLDVPPGVPGFEGFVVDGRTYIYQGLTPVLPRLPLLALDPSLEGRLTGVSMLLGQLVLVGYVIAAAFSARVALRGWVRPGRSELVLTAISVLGLCSGLIGFLSARAWVYHEAVIWGVTCATASLVHLGRLGAHLSERGGRSSTRAVLLQGGLATVFAGFAFNARSSIGVGPYFALGLVCLSVTATIVRRQRRPAAAATGPTTGGLYGLLGVIVAGSLLFVTFYAAVNRARFGTLFSIPLEKQQLVATDPVRLDALAANGGSLFGLRYTPSVAAELLRPDALAPRSIFPYLGFPARRPSVIGGALFAERDWSSSLPDTAPLAFVAALVGVAVLIRARSRSGRGATVSLEGSGNGAAHLRIPAVGAFLSGAPVLVFGYMAQRYALDFYPALVLTAVVGLNWLAARLSADTRPAGSDAEARPGVTRQRGPRVATVILLPALALFGAWSSYSLALQYQREIAPGFVSVQRQSWLATQLAFPGRFSYTTTPSATKLRPGTRIGDLAVVGDCAALYRWSSRAWLLLEARGAGPTAGLRLRIAPARALRGHSRSVTLLESDSGGRHDRLELALVQGGLRLRASFDPARGRLIPFDRNAPDAILDLDMTEDPRIGEVVIRPHGVQRELLTAYREPSGRAAPWQVPQPAAPTLRNEPLATPLCRELEGR